MNINDLAKFNLSDAIMLHDELNPLLFDDTKLDPQVRSQLLVIAQDFIDHLGVKDIEVEDIIIAGSNAAYSYTYHSDIDLHIIVDLSRLENDDVYRELFTAKKNIYNDNHDILIHGAEVELYVESTVEPVKSLGVYSVLKDKWLKFPSRVVRNVSEEIAARKFEKLMFLSAMALHSQDIDLIETLLSTLKRYRQAGLDKAGEFSVENLAYKALRSQGVVHKLYKLRDRLHSHSLSLKEVELNECSGYIPSESEKDDPRWERALSVDVHPQTMKKQAKVMGLGNIARDGRPQQSRTDGKFRK
jgi:hypothetical protein